MKRETESSVKMERVAIFAFGVLFVSLILIFAVAVPQPSVFQYDVFKVVLALAAAGVAAFIPGLLVIEVAAWIRAGGAMAVFVVVYFYSPATAVVDSNYREIKPKLVKPFDRTIYDHFPRDVTLEWEAVPEAVNYEVELQWKHLDDGEWHMIPNYPVVTDATSHNIKFVGAQPGRWRVVAFNNKKQRSEYSDWRQFEFTR